jgi:hypothetical protein
MKLYGLLTVVRRRGPAEQPEPALTSRYAVSFRSRTSSRCGPADAASAASGPRRPAGRVLGEVLQRRADRGRLPTHQLLGGGAVHHHKFIPDRPAIRRRPTPKRHHCG